MEKPRLAVYWAASCGGCEISVANLHERILDIDGFFDFFFCPCLLDTKTKDVAALPEGGIALTLFNGAIRTGENREMAELLREKSSTMIAFGSCASEGCIPGLANLHDSDGFLEAIYHNSPTSENPDHVLPRTSAQVPEGELDLPGFSSRVRTLADVVDVDYSIPGCPPESERIWEVLELVMSGGDLPPKGSVIGAGASNVCRECRRRRQEKKIARLRRTYEAVPEKEQCLLDQGFLCMGVATREGCGALCPEANMPCTGCYGPPEGTLDQGARMAAALGSVLDLGEVRGLDEDALAQRVADVLGGMPDLSGTFYMYSLAGSILRGKRQ